MKKYTKLFTVVLMALVAFGVFAESPVGAKVIDYREQYYAHYRLFNPATGLHRYTTYSGTAFDLRDNYGWIVETVAFYSPLNGTKNLIWLRNPGSGEIFLTTDQNEANMLYNAGWLAAFDAPPTLTLHSGGPDPVYRLYSPVSGEHLWTTSQVEWEVLGQSGWVQEGIAFYAYREPILD